MKNKPSFFSLLNRKMSDGTINAELAETSETRGHLSQSREICPEVVFVEELRPKSRSSNQEPKPRDSAMWQTWEVRCCKTAAGALEWWVQMRNIWLEQKAVCSPKGWIVVHERVSATVKRGSMQVWGCISLNGFGDLVINASVLKNILSLQHF